MKPAVTPKKGHHQEWTLQHNNIVAAMMTLLVMGEVPHQRLVVGKATTTTQQGMSLIACYEGHRK